MVRLETLKLVSRAVSFPRALVFLLQLPAPIPKLPQAAALLPGSFAPPSRARCRWSPTLRWPGALRYFSGTTRNWELLPTLCRPEEY